MSTPRCGSHSAATVRPGAAATGVEPQLTREDRSFSFAGAATVTHGRIETGTGVGVRSVFAGFAGADYAFETYIWIERSSGDVLCEWVPLRECGAEPRIDRVLWPAPLSFDHADAHDVVRSSPTSRA